MLSTKVQMIYQTLNIFLELTCQRKLILYLSDTFIEYLCNLIDYCTTKWRRQYYCTIYNKMKQWCLLAWNV